MADTGKSTKKAAAAEPEVPEDLDYSDLSLDELAALAEKRKVEINRDVEKAEWTRVLRAADRTDAAVEPADTSKRPGDAAREAAERAEVLDYDAASLDELREAGASRGVKLPGDFVRAHLVTELRAAATSTR